VALSRKFDGSREIAVYGAGGAAITAGGACFAPHATGVHQKYFIDDTPSKHGSIFYGSPILNFEEAHTSCKGFQILLCCMSSHVRNTILRSLRESPIEGAEVCTLDEYFFCKHSSEILSVYDRLEDNLSKATYANILLARMGKAPQNQNFVCRNQYFGITEFTVPYPDEVFLDCGAYVGDTIERYLAEKEGTFQKIYAFEPNNANWGALVARTQRLKREWAIAEDKLKLIKAGVGEKSYWTGNHSSEQAGSSYNLWGSEAGEGDVRICSLDEAFAEERISFLKADIEGFEWRMLTGAERVIRRDRPRIAVCIYHSPCDMYRIALKLKELCPAYRFSIRQHKGTRSETVLYAYT